MAHTENHLEYPVEDHQPLSVEDLSAKAQVSRSLVRLCLTNGCPSRDGKVSHAQFLEWLFRHYEKIRAAAGLSALAPIDGVSPEAQKRLRMMNTLSTLLEYAETRASDPDQKERFRQTKLQFHRQLHL